MTPLLSCLIVAVLAMFSWMPATPADESTRKIVNAVTENDYEKVKEMLESKLLAASEDGYGRPLLILAITSGSTEVVDVLLTHGADANRNHISTPPLLWATLLGKCNPEIINLLLDAGAQIDKAGEVTGNTPLLESIAFGNLACARTLVQRGANINATDAKGDGVSHKAILSGSGSMISFVEDLVPREEFRRKNKFHRSACDYAAEVISKRLYAIEVQGVCEGSTGQNT